MQIRGHKRLVASSSVGPGLVLPGSGNVSSWLSQHQELMGSSSRSDSFGTESSHHAPLSPQSSESSGSGSGSEQSPHDDTHPSHIINERNTFLEENSGMRGWYSSLNVLPSHCHPSLSLLDFNFVSDRCPHLAKEFTAAQVFDAVSNDDL